MSRPQRHPKTGVYYLRKRVPAGLKGLVVASEIKISLGTKDPSEARRRHAAELAKLEMRWAQLQSGLLKPTPLEMNVIAGDFYRSIVAEYEMGRMSFFGMMAWSSVAHHFVENPNDEKAHAGFVVALGKRIDAFLTETGRRIHPDWRGGLDYQIARAVLDATARGVDFLGGDFGEDVRVKKYASAERIGIPVPILDAFEEYAKAAKLSPATVKRWKPALLALSVHCKTDDLSRITREHATSWIASLRASDRSARTIRDVYVASAKALFGYRMAEKGLQSSPFEGVTVRVPEKQKLRSLGLTDQEARRILTASLEPQPPRISPQHRAARRWVPWLAAYTGARVNELTQLRRMDIRQEDGIWVMRITPEAGTVKTGRARLVPLHPHLIEQGFMTFVQAVQSGPLFYDAAGSKASAANPPYKKMGERLAKWVLDIGVDDPDIDPNHGWRHRFKTIGRNAGVQDHLLDVIQGHALGTEGRKYGDFSPVMLEAELLKMPRYEIEAATVGRR